MLIFTTSGRLQALAVVLCLSACSEEVAMSGTEVAAANKAAVLRLFDEVLNGGQDQVLPELIAAEFVNTNNGIGGPAGMAAGAAFLRKTFEGPRFVVEDAMAEGDRVAVRWKLFGRHVEPFRGAPPSGAAVVVPAMSMYRMAGGKIAESWVQSGPPQPHGGS
ncbi:ester cyclase [Nannocystis sp. ILAH1]|uniref:ester cyclase n=1 Tax=unclassified Nannocystis TaxID=2627009 RepID=UPI00226F3887|nr:MULTISPECIES: ester cyclase [unclassified Nannocystis]MCY0987035.1 ester cyclase [Nannocystis sp. ILAH1]MCY1071918.1 ester cyclase [Nannocystis sp. RBIL2]